MIAAKHEFASRDSLAMQLAKDVGVVLHTAVITKGGATLAVSGGTTPNLFFKRLSQVNIPWAEVTVTLVDERQVPESSARSNAHLVRNLLMQNQATAARFVPLYNNPQAAQLSSFDAAVLGMGLDGHTASFLPGSDRLAEALDPATPERIVEIAAPGLESRLTFTLPVLLASDYIALHIEGAEKLAVLDAALEDGPIEDMPIRAFLRSAVPVALYWCP